MANTVQNLLQKALGDGARSSKWDIAFSFSSPSIFPTPENVAVMCKASQLPARGMQTIPIKIKGRTIPVRGQVKYSNNWQCTFYSDPSHKLKHAFETWINACDEGLQYEDPDIDTEKNIMEHAKTGYVKDICIYQCDFDETQNTCRYIIHNVFPIEVSTIPLDGDVGQVETFDVTFSYSHFEIDSMKGEAGNFVGGFMQKLKGATQDMITSLTGKLTNEIDSFLNNSGINSLADNLANLPGNLMDGIGSAFGDAFSEALSKGLSGDGGSEFSSSFANGIGSITSGIGFLSSAANSVISSATNLASQAAAEIGKLAGKATAFIGSSLKSIANSIANMTGLSSLLGSANGQLKEKLGDQYNESKVQAQNLNASILQKTYQT